MRHRLNIPKLSMKRSHRKSVLTNLAKALIKYEKVDTTFACGKAAQPYTEKMITLGRRGDLHARRIVFSKFQDKEVVDKLFTEIGPRYKDRPGGYTRLLKLGPRKGDGAEMVRILLV